MPVAAAKAISRCRSRAPQRTRVDHVNTKKKKNKRWNAGKKARIGCACRDACCRESPYRRNVSMEAPLSVSALHIHARRFLTRMCTFPWSHPHSRLLSLSLRCRSHHAFVPLSLSVSFSSRFCLSLSLFLSLSLSLSLSFAALLSNSPSQHCSATRLRSSVALALSPVVNLRNEPFGIQYSNVAATVSGRGRAAVQAARERLSEDYDDELVAQR